MARIVVIGSGAGGLSSAARLATRRHDVTVVEARDELGGRMRPINGLSVVPDIVTLPAPLRDLFNKTGAGLESVIDLQPAAPTLVWTASNEIIELPSVGPAAVADALGAVLGAKVANGYRQLMQEAAAIWQEVRQPLLETPGGTPRWLVDELGGWRGIRTLRPQMSYARATAGVGSDDVRALLDLEALEAGSLPSRLAAWHITRPYVRWLFGEWEVPGGLVRLADELVARATERGAHLRIGSLVTQVKTAGGRVSSVELASGELIEADWVVADIDDLAALLPADRTSVRSGADLSACVVELTVPANAVATAVGDATRITVLPTQRHSALQHLQATALPADPWLTVERRAEGTERWVVRIVVNTNVIATSGEISDLVIDTLRRRGLVESDAPVEAIQVLAPKDIGTHLHTPRGRLWGAAAASTWRGLLRPPVATDIAGLVRAGGSVVAGPGLPYAVQSGEVVADVIGRPKSAKSS